MNKDPFEIFKEQLCLCFDAYQLDIFGYDESMCAAVGTIALFVKMMDLEPEFNCKFLEGFKKDMENMRKEKEENENNI